MFLCGRVLVCVCARARVCMYVRLSHRMTVTNLSTYVHLRGFTTVYSFWYSILYIPTYTCVFIQMIHTYNFLSLSLSLSMHSHAHHNAERRGEEKKKGTRARSHTHTCTHSAVHLLNGRRGQERPWQDRGVYQKHSSHDATAALWYIRTLSTPLQRLSPGLCES